LIFISDPILFLFGFRVQGLPLAGIVWFPVGTLFRLPTGHVEIPAAEMDGENQQFPKPKKAKILNREEKRDK